MESIESTGLSKLVLRTVEVYNRYRSPEATAKLLKLKKNGFIVQFEGSFCQSCGVQDFFEDFIYELEGLNSVVEVRIGRVEQTGPQSFQVEFVVRDDFSGGKLDKEKLFRKFLRERGLSVADYTSANPCTKDVIRFHFRTWLFETKSKRSRLGV